MKNESWEDLTFADLKSMRDMAKGAIAATHTVKNQQYWNKVLKELESEILGRFQILIPEKEKDAQT